MPAGNTLVRPFGSVPAAITGQICSTVARPAQRRTRSIKTAITTRVTQQPVGVKLAEPAAFELLALPSPVYKRRYYWIPPGDLR